MLRRGSGVMIAQICTLVGAALLQGQTVAQWRRQDFVTGRK